MAETPQEAPNALKEQIKSLRDCIRAGPPFCQGTVSVPISDLTLFYGTVDNAHRIDFPTATPTQLQLLTDFCQPATFGVNQQDVLDETYRKAGKLDSEDFMIRFDPVHSGIIDTIHSELAIDRLVKDDTIRAELYKLNVYGPSSFFKPHVDTPRSALQFGSLVIVFPTAHEGGALKIRHAEESHAPGERAEWTFDSSAILSACTEPSLAYVAFFSDVEHEVLPVTSGHRITVTYNLYWNTTSKESTKPPSVPRPISGTEETLRATMQKLLDDPTFLPDGGHLMFGLSHQYPLAPEKEDDAARKALQGVRHRLKANDAIIYRVMHELSLDVSLRTIYTLKEEYADTYNHIACDRVLPLEDAGRVEEPIWETMCTNWGAMLLSEPMYYEEKYHPPITPVEWVTDAPKFAHQKTTFIAYGNQASIGVAYWRIYLLVRVGPAGDRSGEPRGKANAEEKAKEQV